MENLKDIQLLGTNYHSRGTVYNVICDKGEDFIKKSFKTADLKHSFKVYHVKENIYKVFSTLIPYATRVRRGLPL